MMKYFKKANNFIRFIIEILKDPLSEKKYKLGEMYSKDSFHLNGQVKTKKEIEKIPQRYDVINYLLKSLNRDTAYLEIGVRIPEDNFDKINSSLKHSVDPGYENQINPVDFKCTSDIFFDKIRDGQILDKEVKFDVIFIDGLHLAEQTESDIKNSLDLLYDDGFIVLHDCNPPTEFHASETYEYRLSPSQDYWNGTTWKAFFKIRQETNLYSCCIDSDWGVGIISKTKRLGETTRVPNPYFEYSILKKNRKESLNLMSFDDFKMIIK